MSGIEEVGGLPGFEFGQKASQRNLDQYYNVQVQNPTVNTAWFAAGTTTGTTPIALVLTNQLADWPRNLYYNYTGGTTGGTFVVNLIDQFGVNYTETVSQGSTTSNGSVYGTQIAMKYLSGSFFPNTSIAGTMTVGVGTASNGSAASNWFGLMTKVAGTSDLKAIRWINNGTVTALNKGTNLGTLINTSTHSFQGTSGVAITDTYDAILVPKYDNSGKGTMSGL